MLSVHMTFINAFNAITTLPLLFKLFAVLGNLFNMFLSAAKREIKSVVWLLIVLVPGNNCSIICCLILIVNVFYGNYSSCLFFYVT